MKDLEAATSEAAAAKRMSETKMHDYKGFTVEPIPGGFNIVMYGIKHILYIAGPGGWRLTEDPREARAFRDPKTCHDMIDEMIADWQGWIDSTKPRPVVNLEAEKNKATQEQVLQNGTVMKNGVVSEAGVKYRSSIVL